MNIFQRISVFNDKIKSKSESNIAYIYFWGLIQYVFKGMKFGDFLGYELEKKSLHERNTYISARDRHKYEKMFNYKNTELLLNKVEFDKMFSEFLKRDFFFAKENPFEDFAKFVEKHPTFFAKKIWACEGQGIEKVTITEATDLNELYKEYTSDFVLLEEPVVQHHKMAELNSASVNTIRVSTIKHNGTVHILAASLRIGNGKGCTDNLHGGGICCAIDIESGITKSAGFNNNGDVLYKHPYTNAAVIGFQIPFWNEVIETTKKCAKIIDGVNWIGWDVAITENGPVIIEGNTDQAPDLIQLGNCGLNPKIKEILKK